MVSAFPKIQLLVEVRKAVACSEVAEVRQAERAQLDRRRRVLPALQAEVPVYGGRVAVAVSGLLEVGFTRLRQVCKLHYVQFTVQAAELFTLVCMSRVANSESASQMRPFFHSRVADLVRWKNFSKFLRTLANSNSSLFYGVRLGGRLGKPSPHPASRVLTRLA